MQNSSAGKLVSKHYLFHTTFWVIFRRDTPERKQGAYQNTTARTADWHIVGKKQTKKQTTKQNKKIQESD